MKTAVFPGSFDPVTVGHIELIKTASGLFDKLYIVLMKNSDKKPMFSVSERIEMLKLSLDGIKNTEITAYDGFLTDFCKSSGTDYVVRGARNSFDFEYEKMLANVYSKADVNIKTVIIPSLGENEFVSSTVAREFLRYGKNCDGIIPKKAFEYITGLRKEK